jgi:hypothetical protein
MMIPLGIFFAIHLLLTMPIVPSGTMDDCQIEHPEFSTDMLEEGECQ